MKAYEQKNVSDINLEDYLGEYEEKQATVQNLIYDRNRRKESLDGLWHYAVDQYDTCIRQHWFEERKFDANGNTLPLDYSFDEWPVMQLPCSWNTVAERFFLYEGSMIFTRTFRLRKNPGERVFLKIGAANYICRVFVNKQYLGMHRGGSTPAYFELTDVLKDEDGTTALAPENRILIQVDATRRPEQVPTENTDWFNYGGLYREIEIIRVPETFIKRFQVELVPDGSYRKVRVQTELAGVQEGIRYTACISISELNISETFDIGQDGHGEIVVDAEPELWSPENPKLYEVNLKVMAAGAADGFQDAATKEVTDGVRDVVTDMVGFREIRVEGRDILLNGKKIFLKGISCHEESVPHGRH